MAESMDDTTIITAVANWLTPSAALAQAARPAPLGESRSVRATAVRFGYRVGSLGFLVGPGVLSELLPTPEIYPIPNVPPALRGYVNRQGALVPVWDVRVLIGDHSQHDEAQDGRESILLLGRGDRRIGIIINGLPHALKQFNAVPRLPQLPEMLQGYVKEALFAANALWFEFDHAAFFGAQTDKANAA